MTKNKAKKVPFFAQPFTPTNLVPVTPVARVDLLDLSFYSFEFILSRKSSMRRSGRVQLNAEAAALTDGKVNDQAVSTIYRSIHAFTNHSL